MAERRDLGIDLEEQETVWRLLELAESEARSMGHSSVGSGHLLLAFMQLEGSDVSRILLEAGLKVSDVREKLKLILGSGHKLDEGQLEILPIVKINLRDAARRAASDGSGYIYSAYVFDAFVQREGVGSSVLSLLGVTSETLRKKTNDLLLRARVL